MRSIGRFQRPPERISDPLFPGHSPGIQTRPPPIARQGQVYRTRTLRFRSLAVKCSGTHFGRPIVQWGALYRRFAQGDLEPRNGAVPCNVR